MLLVLQVMQSDNSFKGRQINILLLLIEHQSIPGIITWGVLSKLSVLFAPNSAESSHIIQQLRLGDREVIEELYRQGFHMCAAFITRNSGTNDDARDLFQEALMVLFRNVQNTSFTLTCEVTTYLFSVVRNLWLKQLNKKNKGGLSLVMDDEGNVPFVLVEENEIEYKRKKEKQHVLVAEMLKQIKEDCKELLLKYYFNRIPLKEVGKMMGYTDAFVKVKKNRCMESLKKRVKSHQSKS